MMMRNAQAGRALNLVATAVLALWPALGAAQTPAAEPTPAPAAAEAAEEEEEGGFSWGLDLDAVSEYNWRGLILNDSFSFQPGLWGSYAGFTASVWLQIATEGNENEDGEQQTLEEIDLSLEWAHSFGSWGLGLGYIHYEYPGFQVGATNEVYVSLSYDTMIAPSFGVYRDFDLESWYFEFGLAPEFTVFEKATFSPSALVAIFTSDLEDTQDLNRGSLGAALSYPLGERLSISGQVRYEIPFSDEIEDVFEDRFWGGVGLHLAM